ncbi:chromate transporter [soil metagenome]
MDADGQTDGMLVPMLLYFSLMSLTAIGGGVIMLAPDVHRWVVDAHHLMTSEDFAAAFTIAQASPGPNVLFISLIGLKVAGVPGALASTVAVVLPSFLFTLAVVRFGSHRPAGPFGNAIKRGLAPISVGLLAAGGLVLAKAADSGVIALLMTAATVALMVRTKINPVWLIAIGAVIGVALQL